MAYVSTIAAQPQYHLDVVATKVHRFAVSVPVVVAVQPSADPARMSVDVWDLPTARVIQADKERIAADYERDADECDRLGKPADAALFRKFAADLLTQARDLLVVLQGAEERRAA